jgi:ANTAR domain
MMKQSADDGSSQFADRASAGRTRQTTSVTEEVIKLVGRDLLVHQATGMVSAQLDCDIVEAAARLAEHARTTGQELPEVARDVVTRRKRFT